MKVTENWSVMKHVLVWAIFLALLIGGLRFAGVISLPIWLEFERKAFVASHQYIENKRSAIAKYVAQCNQLDAGAQKSVLQQKITTEKALLPEGEGYNLGVCR